MGRLTTWSVPMTTDEKAFCKALGQCIAKRRKQLNLTQIQLGELLEISQQHVASYEVGRRRVSVTMLPVLAKTLGISVEALIGEESDTTKNKRGPTSKLQRQVEKISQLPRTKQKLASDMLEAVIQQGR